MGEKHMSTQSGSVYLCVWGQGYEKQFEAPRDASFFCENNGYCESIIKAVSALKIGESIDMSDLSGVHTVKRIK